MGNETGWEIASTLANLVVAFTAAIAIYLAWKQTREADRHLIEDRELAARQRRAELELERVFTVATLHAERSSGSIVLSPAELGRISASLDGLPAGSLPLARSEYIRDVEPPSPGLAATFTERWTAIRDELSDELQRLTRLAAGE